MTRKAQHASILLPNRHWLRRSFIVLLMVVSLALLVMSKNENAAVVKLRTTVLDTVTPVIAIAASPFDALASAGEWVVSFARTRSENIALKNQNLQLLQWQTAAKQLESENASLKALLHTLPSQKASYITARMVADLSGPFAQAGLINGGSEQGIKRDQAVINEYGLVGRVIEAGKSSARVLLLSDVNSRVPVIAEHARVKSMLAGNSARLPTLAYLPPNHGLEVGERLVTSGDGGIFPPGIPVGVITDIDGGTVTVQPLADAARIEYVSAVDYNF